MTTFFDLSYEVARALGALRSGTATGGTTTTLVDTLYRTEDDDYFNKGTVWIIGTTDGAAPQGELRAVSDFVQGTSTLTVSAAFTVAPGAGDHYAIEKGRYQLPVIRDMINQALRHLGRITQYDESLTTADNQTEYDLPAAAADELLQVWVERNTGDANDNQWAPVPNPEVQRNNTAGGTATLIIPQYDSGRSILLVYRALHPALHDEDDILHDGIHPDLVVYRAAWNLLQFYRDKIRADDEFVARKRDLELQMEEAEALHKLPAPPPKTRKLMLPWGAQRDRWQPWNYKGG